MAGGSGLDVNCPACNGRGLDRYDRVCKVCGSGGRVTHAERQLWREKNKARLEDLKRLQYPFPLAADNI